MKTNTTTTLQGPHLHFASIDIAKAVISNPENIGLTIPQLRKQCALISMADIEKFNAFTPRLWGCTGDAFITCGSVTVDGLDPEKRLVYTVDFEEVEGTAVYTVAIRDMYVNQQVGTTTLGNQRDVFRFVAFDCIRRSENPAKYAKTIARTMKKTGQTLAQATLQA